jgi:molybdopterin-synthase adenylyltransferase
MTTITRPKLQPTVVAVPLPRSRIAIQRGTRQASGYLFVEDPEGWRATVIKHMKGDCTVEELTRSLSNGSAGLDVTQLKYFVSDLAEAGIVADASFFATDGLRADEVDRYSRNLNGWSALSRDGRTASQLQQELGRGRVLMLGAGGLGSVASVALAMAGCHNITVVDFDTIELTNLNRQLYTTGEVGMVKVDALKQRLEAINPDIRVDVVPTRLNGPEHVRRVVEQVAPDIVVAAIDRPVIAADRWISDACFKFGVPCICNSVSAGTGMVWSKVPGKTGCFNCDELWSKEKSPDHYEVRRYREKFDVIPGTSAFSFGAMAVGAMIASEVVRCLVKWPMATAGRLVVLDFASLTTTVTDKPAHPDCPVCKQDSLGDRP